MPIIKSLGLVELQGTFGKAPMRAFQKGDITLVVNGTDPATGVSAVATQPAAVAAQLGITMFDPDMVINTGTAGAFRCRGSEIGDVYLGTHHQFHDRRIPIPGFDQYGRGDYQSALPVGLVEKISLPEAGVSTGNSLDYTGGDLEVIKSMGASMPIVKEMEAAAIAQVAPWYEITFFSIKSVTDLIDGGRASAEEFQENLELAAQNLAVQATRVVQAIRG